MKTSFNHYIDKLKGDYKTTFNEIETYGWSVDVDNILFEEKMGELLDVFISAQEEERPVKTIVGDDINIFCNNFFSDIPKASLVKEFFDSLKRVAWLVLVLDILSIFIDFGAGIFTETDAGSLIFIFVGSYILSRLVGILLRKILFKTSLNYKFKRVIFAVFEIALTILIVVVVDLNWADKFTVPTLVEMAVTAIYLVIYYFFNTKRLADDKKIRGGARFISDLTEQMESQMVDKFRKENAKRERKGKSVFSWEEYLAKEKKITDQTQVLAKVIILLPALITALLVLQMYFVGGIKSTQDMLCFIVPILVIEYIIFIPFYKFIMYIYKGRKAWGEKQNS